MKQVEMWKWFKLPVDCELIPTDCTGDSDSVSFSGAEMLTAHHVEKVEIAINSYDANQEIIAKHAEQIEKQKQMLIILRKALVKIIPLPSSKHTECADIACEALRATKEQA